MIAKVKLNALGVNHFGSGPAYSCNSAKCKNFFHKSCAEFPWTIQHPFGLHHPLTLERVMFEFIQRFSHKHGLRLGLWQFPFSWDLEYLDLPPLMINCRLCLLSLGTHQCHGGLDCKYFINKECVDPPPSKA